ncbi:MAG TPA: glycoside hydrolase family 3 C-terminal domain-containing protein [Saprospiraceae bacterium]|nr:glycoside hydrolase family 3 C-terminal domain-containing protein [Saprospiraceae bacterium]
MNHQFSMVAIIVCFLCHVNAQESKDISFRNTNLSFEQRAEDIISRLTLDEKVQQMMNHAPAIERLGIPAYDWWNEVLHGVARTPFHTTSYPQAIGMAATWDTTSLKKMAYFSALEGRAVHNKAIALGRENERYMGLTYWTPNINIFRDPRWGRGQETYGEDPFLTGKLGGAFVRGLQGDDPTYMLAAACAKHFAVHSGPEPSRHSDNFNTSEYDLWDTYLPAFKELVTKAKVEGVMCAYNAFRDQPCCASDGLMRQILREKWGFKGYVTSDCWGLDDFFSFHKTHPDKLSAAIDALIHTTDVECGKDVFLSLAEGVRSGRINESLIDASVKRLFTTRLKLGMFDPPALVKYAQTPESVLEAKEHGQHALKMAQQSIVLLKNENNTLPLSKDMKKIVVFGPNADNKISILGNYNGTPSDPVTVFDGIQRKIGNKTKVVFEQAINFTNDTIMVYEDNDHLFAWEGKPGVEVSYFNNETLQGEAVFVTQLPEINKFWAEGESPAKGVNNFHYSTRFRTILTPVDSRMMNFEIEGDDGYKLYINDSLYIDAWERNRWGAKQISLSVIKGKAYKITIEHRQSEGQAKIRFKSGALRKTNFESLIAKHQDADVFIFAGGISPQLEGEEMKVNFPGFNGGDRTTILLPEVQSRFMAVLQKSGKPVVFVMMTGSAIAIPKEDKTIPAIMNTWYGGQAAGLAIADVLFGDYNPAGRLPLTFYKSDADLPDFKNYDMDNRTYRYFKGEVLYPFGYGLSYTTFSYADVKVDKNHQKGKPITLKTKVTNTGKKGGEEVVQCYISHTAKDVRKPIRALKGFQRIFLKAGETKEISFTLTAEDLSIVNENGEMYQPSGQLDISIGGGQPDADSIKNQTVKSVMVIVKD